MKNFHAGFYINQGRYKSFQPERINREWVISDMETISLLSEASSALGKLDMYSNHIPNLDLFIGMHVAKEATKSSQIEGTQTAIEEAIMSVEDVPLDKRDDWEEVQQYISAMNEAIQALDTLPFSSRLIRNTHKTLLSGVRGATKQPGEFRYSQNWIGGNNINDAVFVPPIHTSIEELMEDIELFVHNNTVILPDLIKIAIIHYQFETIHPFLDGNGRIGRLMITLYLVYKGLLGRPILYLSDYLEKHRNSYYTCLMRAREKHDLTGWVNFFLKGIIETSQRGIDTFSQILRLQKEYDSRIQQLGSKTANAAKLLNKLYLHPLVKSSMVVRTLEISPPTANNLLRSLEEIGILREITGAKRDKTYMMFEYLRLFTDQ